MPSQKLIGDMLHDALVKVGITEERVSKALGRPCRCRARQEKLNRLHTWALRILSGRTSNADKYLEEIIGDDQRRDGEVDQTADGATPST